MNCLLAEAPLLCHIMYKITVVAQLIAIALRNDRDILQGINMLDNLQQVSKLF